MILENKIYDVIRRMTLTLNTTQLQNLKDTLFVVFENCEIVDNSEHTELAVVNDSWKYDLQDFLTSKTLEGKRMKHLNVIVTKWFVCFNI